MMQKEPTPSRFWPLISIGVVIHLVGLLLLRWHILGILQPGTAEGPSDLHTSYTILGAMGSAGLMTSSVALYALLRWAPVAWRSLLFGGVTLFTMFLSISYLYAILLFQGII